MKLKLSLVTGETLNLEVPDSIEDVLIEQMGKPINKRKYTYGIDFSQVKQVEVLEDEK